MAHSRYIVQPLLRESRLSLPEGQTVVVMAQAANPGRIVYSDPGMQHPVFNLRKAVKSGCPELKQRLSGVHFTIAILNNPNQASGTALLKAAAAEFGLVPPRTRLHRIKVSIPVGASSFSGVSIS